MIYLIESGGGTGPMKPGNHWTCETCTERCQFLQNLYRGFDRWGRGRLRTQTLPSGRVFFR